MLLMKSSLRGNPPKKVGGDMRNRKRKEGNYKGMHPD